MTMDQCSPGQQSKILHSPRESSDKAAYEDKEDQEAGAGRPTIVAAGAHTETAHIPKDPPTMPRDVAQPPTFTNKIALT